MKTLPKTIYVRVEEPGKDGYLAADIVPHGADGDKIGTYRLVSVGEVETHADTIRNNKATR